MYVLYVCRAKLRREAEQPSGSCQNKSTSHQMHKATLNRAVKRAQTTLPTSPRKCQKVIQKLAVKFSPESFLPPFKRKERAHVNVDVLTDVLNFYERDDISTQAAGKKEFVIRENGEKTRVQK